MTAGNTAMPKLLGLYETHLTVADLQTSTDFYRDVVGLEPAASFEERKVAFLWVDDKKTGMLGLWETGTGPLKMRLHIAFRMTAAGVLQAPALLKEKGVEPLATGEGNCASRRFSVFPPHDRQPDTHQPVPRGRTLPFRFRAAL
ncbi:MAG TPA: VOC family protein [Rhizobium sp.]|uniref:VOC family protein n=1 Tax=Rhizobium sp. F40D2 TaxID=3453141 RepID=UPI002D0675E4|nr:VOC family protein [Rhizobium sp.]